MKNSLENKLPSSVEEGMPGPTATAGVVGVPCSLTTNYRDSGAEGRVGSPIDNPLKSPLVQGGTLVFIERCAVLVGMKSCDVRLSSRTSIQMSRRTKPFRSAQ